jgi:hypothetical protein
MSDWGEGAVPSLALSEMLYLRSYCSLRVQAVAVLQPAGQNCERRISALQPCRALPSLRESV